MQLSTPFHSWFCCDHMEYRRLTVLCFLRILPIKLGSLLEEMSHCPDRSEEEEEVRKSCPIPDSAAERDQKDLVD